MLICDVIYHNRIKSSDLERKTLIVQRDTMHGAETLRNWCWLVCL